ncbi:MAG TPA: glycosyl hydrolase [Terriglobia bacterium]|nr:glycosyl hydrolase [Terriglobia bacterium]
MTNTMIRILEDLTPEKLRPRIERLFDLSAQKIRAIEAAWDASQGAPVITVRGIYTAREWTQWTEGFLYGSALLQYDATDDRWFLEYGRRNTIERMAPHVTHMGVHDHGFNNVSTYGNLLRLAAEKRWTVSETEIQLYVLALKVSGAVQAARWTALSDDRGYIYSFNGPHSLFVDTIRSLRSLALAHSLGHVLMGENERRISLLDRLCQHADVTAEFAVYYGEGRDLYDVRGRVSHESLFNINAGGYRCPATQQGYSPFTTWTRGLAWIICGYAEQLEFLESVADRDLEPQGGREKVVAMMRRPAEATCDYYLDQAAQDGIPYWDTGAPGLEKLGDWQHQPANPFNEYEPVDSSAAAIAAQGLWRMGNIEARSGSPGKAKQYRQAALTIANTLFEEPYLSTDSKHQGLILHSVYHRPKGWDEIPSGRRIPCGESSMWGDYHARELALLLLREAKGGPYLDFFHAASHLPADLMGK